MFLCLKFLVFILLAFSLKSVESFEKSRSWNVSGVFPFYVNIKQGDLLWCPGSLIRPQWVIISWNCGETLEIDESTTVESLDQVKHVFLKKQIEDEIWFWNQETPYLLQLKDPFEITPKTKVIAISPRQVADLQLVKVIGDDNLSDLKFNFFIHLKFSDTRKMKQRALSPGSDCYVSDDTH